MRETEHVAFAYHDHSSLTCSFCQSTVTRDGKVGEDMKRTYTIASIDEKDRNSGKRRMVVVELQRKSEPNSLGETGSKTDTIVVEYPAYGDTHYVNSVSKHMSGKTIDFIEAKAIAKEIKKFIGMED